MRDERRERRQRRGVIALHHGLGNGMFAGGGLLVGDGVCARVCVCVCNTSTVHSPSTAEHQMIKDCVHAAYRAVSSWWLHLCVCVCVRVCVYVCDACQWLCTYEQNLNNSYDQEGIIVTPHFIDHVPKPLGSHK